MRIIKFSEEAMDLYLQQHFMLKDKIQAANDELQGELQVKILQTFSQLHKLLTTEDPHVRVIVGVGGNFREGKEIFLMRYSSFCRRKKLFEYPNNMVSFIPPEFNNFMEFARFAIQSGNK